MGEKAIWLDILLQLPSWFSDEKSVYHSRLCLTILTCIVEVRPSCGILSAWVPALTELQPFCYFHQPPVLRSGAETNILCTTGSLVDINWHVPWKTIYGDNGYFSLLQDQFANAFLHDPNMTFPVTLHRAVSVKRKYTCTTLCKINEPHPPVEQSYVDWNMFCTVRPVI